MADNVLGRNVAGATRKMFLRHVKRRLSGESGMTQGSIKLELSLLFPERTLEAITCLRRNTAFRALVNATNLMGQDALPHDGEGGQPEPATQAAVTAALAEISCACPRRRWRS